MKIDGRRLGEHNSNVVPGLARRSYGRAARSSSSRRAKTVLTEPAAFTAGPCPSPSFSCRCGLPNWSCPDSLAGKACSKRNRAAVLPGYPIRFQAAKLLGRFV